MESLIIYSIIFWSIYILGLIIVTQTLAVRIFPLPEYDLSLTMNEYVLDHNLAAKKQLMAGIIWPVTVCVWLSEDNQRRLKLLLYWLFSWLFYVTLGLYFSVFMVVSSLFSIKPLK